MQYKLPIVTTNEGGIPDIVTDGVNGYICERKDVTEFADAIEKLITDKAKYEEFGESGYHIFKERYTLSTFYKNIMNCLKNFAKKNMTI
jgi:glycosyltransferase involved in cell wall biosynthesis